MAQAYTPGLRITENTVIRRERRLPLQGDVLVKKGDRVKARDIVARTFLPGDVTPLNVASNIDDGSRGLLMSGRRFFAITSSDGRRPTASPRSSCATADLLNVRNTGPRVLTFAPILKYQHPLPGLLARLLAVGREGMGTAVEMEFAVNMGDDPADFEFYFLQIRPMVARAESFAVKISREEESRAFCRCRQALGHGVLELNDLLYVRPDNFKPKYTAMIAAEIGVFNARLGSERPYLLIGPGRWGSADPWLGIPVQWQDIANVGAMVELRNDQLRVDPSQGTHFFHNITSLAIPYLTVDESRDRFDRQWLEQLPVQQETKFLRHVRLDKPLRIKVDGRSSRGIIFM